MRTNVCREKKSSTPSRAQCYKTVKLLRKMEFFLLRRVNFQNHNAIKFYSENEGKIKNHPVHRFLI